MSRQIKQISAKAEAFNEIQIQEATSVPI